MAVSVGKVEEVRNNLLSQKTKFSEISSLGNSIAQLTESVSSLPNVYGTDKGSEVEKKLLNYIDSLNGIDVNQFVSIVQQIEETISRKSVTEYYR